MSFSIVFLMFPGVTQLDMTGPAQVLSRLPDGEVAYAAVTMDPIPTDCGFSIVPTTVLSDVDHADLICIPGGFGIVDAMRDEAFMAEVKRLGASATYVTSVCTGALVLGAAGLLKGKNATTHWAYHDILSSVGANPVKARVVRDGNTFTGGGVTAGIDFGLTVIAEVASEMHARRIAVGVEYDPMPPFGRGVREQQPADVGEVLDTFYRPNVARTRTAVEEVFKLS